MLIQKFWFTRKRWSQKIQHGAVGIITQPVLILKMLKTFRIFWKCKRECWWWEEKKSSTNSWTFPITKLRTALFLSAQGSGIHVPQFWIDELEKAHSISEEERV